MKTFLLPLAVVLLALSGCATTPPPHAFKSMVKTELYFGQTKRDGSTISPKQWKHFLDTEITPRFPDGLTLIPTEGQWRTDKGKLIREKTWLLILIHPKGSVDQKRIEAIRETYHQRFEQDLVLEVTSPVTASF